MPSVKHEAWALLSLGLLFPALAYAADGLPIPVASANREVITLGEFAAPLDHTIVMPIAASPGAQVASLPDNADPAAVAAAPQEPPQTSTAGLGTGVAANTLDQYRGGTAISSEAVSTGLLQDATATNVATGNNSIAGGAFTNAFGLPIVIQNSGANVLIQNSTIVNVEFR